MILCDYLTGVCNGVPAVNDDRLTHILSVVPSIGHNHHLRRGDVYLTYKAFTAGTPRGAFLHREPSP